MDRITAIRKSLAAFVCGIIGVVPLIGFVPAVWALVSWRQVRTRYRDEWNPASAYLSWGARLGLLGLIGSALLMFALVFAFIAEAFD